MPSVSKFEAKCTKSLFSYPVTQIDRPFFVILLIFIFCLNRFCDLFTFDNKCRSSRQDDFCGRQTGDWRWRRKYNNVRFLDCHLLLAVTFLLHTHTDRRHFHQNKKRRHCLASALVKSCANIEQLDASVSLFGFLLFYGKTFFFIERRPLFQAFEFSLADEMSLLSTKALNFLGQTLLDIILALNLHKVQKQFLHLSLTSNLTFLNSLGWTNKTLSCLLSRTLSRPVPMVCSFFGRIFFSIELLSDISFWIFFISFIVRRGEKRLARKSLL